MEKNEHGTQYHRSSGAAPSSSSSYKSLQKVYAYDDVSWVGSDRQPWDGCYAADDEELYAQQPTTPGARPTFNPWCLADDRVPGMPQG